MFLLVIRTMFFMAAVWGYQDFDKKVNRSQSLITNIRRQLMHDNYDYSFERNKSNNTEKVETTTIISAVRRNFYLSKPKGKGKNNSSYDLDENQKYKKTDSKSKKYLLGEIDDSLEPGRHPIDIKNTESTAKYRFLKIKHQYRRNNQPRLIQEENKDGVAIVNLDRGPFPELRLSKSRRQYMHQRGELVTEEKEVPPPPVNNSDPEAAVEDFDETELNKRKV